MEYILNHIKSGQGRRINTTIDVLPKYSLMVYVHIPTKKVWIASTRNPISHYENFVRMTKRTRVNNSELLDYHRHFIPGTRLDDWFVMQDLGGFKGSINRPKLLNLCKLTELKRIPKGLQQEIDDTKFTLVRVVHMGTNFARWSIVDKSWPSDVVKNNVKARAGSSGNSFIAKLRMERIVPNYDHHRDVFKNANNCDLVIEYDHGETFDATRPELFGKVTRKLNIADLKKFAKHLNSKS